MNKQSWKNFSLYQRIMILAGILFTFSVIPALAGTIANHNVSGPIWYRATSTDHTLRYVWQSQTASPSYSFQPNGSGTFHLYNGYSPTPNVVNSSVWSENWNWTTCYTGSGSAGTLNIWCRRTT